MVCIIIEIVVEVIAITLYSIVFYRYYSKRKLHKSMDLRDKARSDLYLAQLRSQSAPTLLGLAPSRLRSPSTPCHHDSHLRHMVRWATFKRRLPSHRAVGLHRLPSPSRLSLLATRQPSRSSCKRHRSRLLRLPPGHSKTALSRHRLPQTTTSLSHPRHRHRQHRLLTRMSHAMMLCRSQVPTPIRLSRAHRPQGQHSNECRRRSSSLGYAYWSGCFLDLIQNKNSPGVCLFYVLNCFLCAAYYFQSRHIIPLSSSFCLHTSVYIPQTSIWETFISSRIARLGWHIWRIFFSLYEFIF